jgi:hypothetical protein
MKVLIIRVFIKNGLDLIGAGFTDLGAIVRGSGVSCKLYADSADK